MKKASEYREHAEECRRLARTARNEEDRRALMQMAEAWEDMAKYRERHTARARKPDSN